MLKVFTRSHRPFDGNGYRNTNNKIIKITVSIPKLEVCEPRKEGGLYLWMVGK
jgi:hypothetical protein